MSWRNASRLPYKLSWKLGGELASQHRFASKDDHAITPSGLQLQLCYPHESRCDQSYEVHGELVGHYCCSPHFMQGKLHSRLGFSLTFTWKVAVYRELSVEARMYLPDSSGVRRFCNTGISCLACSIRRAAQGVLEIKSRLHNMES